MKAVGSRAGEYLGSGLSSSEGGAWNLTVLNGIQQSICLLGSAQIINRTTEEIGHDSA